MTAWTKSNIDIQGTRNPKLEELYVGMEVVRMSIGEYDSTNELNFFPYIITQKDIDNCTIWENSEQDLRYSPGLPLYNFRINK